MASSRTVHYLLTDLRHGWRRTLIRILPSLLGRPDEGVRAYVFRNAPSSFSAPLKGVPFQNSGASIVYRDRGSLFRAGFTRQVKSDGQEFPSYTGGRFAWLLRGTWPLGISSRHLCVSTLEVLPESVRSLTLKTLIGGRSITKLSPSSGRRWVGVGLGGLGRG